LILFSILLFNTFSDIHDDRTLFIQPVKIPLALSANFGELRIDHFHSGIDIRTQGVTGKEVVAAAEGYVSRIGVSPTGFGNALYIRHPSGYSTVYGHLERFTPEIDAYVKAQQYERKSFAVTLFPPKDKFQVKQGDIIAFSGNSGGSGGPHLHFEVRKADSEIPVNPLLFNFGPADNIKPVIERLFIYPVIDDSEINSLHKTMKISVAGNNGNYYVPAGN
jgi:murein DD-endopeptidase MepM/ murein hydrolase activator NlpD